MFPCCFCVFSGLTNYKKKRKMRRKEKCRHLKLTCKGTLRQVFICLGPLSSYVFVWGELAML
jgi:hypothetical protein